MSTQTTETLSQRVIELVSRQVDIPKERISLDSQFTADLGFDSLDLVEFVMTVEDEFDITVPDEVHEKIVTLRNAVQAIEKLIS
jgi:acyl carrier protein